MATFCFVDEFGCFRWHFWFTPVVFFFCVNLCWKPQYLFKGTKPQKLARYPNYVFFNMFEKSIRRVTCSYLHWLGSFTLSESENESDTRRVKKLKIYKGKDWRANFAFAFAFDKCAHAPIMFLRSYYDDTENCPQWENNTVFTMMIPSVLLLATGCHTRSMELL